MVGAGAAQLLAELGDLEVELVDQVQGRVDCLAPGLVEVESLQELAAGEAEQVSDRASTSASRGAR